jgi:glycosyltransferase involved in cell wall biosynthesis
MDRFVFAARVDDDAPLVFLGRVERIKGPHIAARMAKASGRRLILAGNVPEERVHRDFFEREVRPHIDEDRVTFVGPVNDAQKSDLLSRAAALLMPILWDEPFGIVMAEALACGTPVVGFGRGAVPEVVADGITGFVRQTEEELAMALAGIPRLKRIDCRKAAEARFSGAALVDAYENLYEEILGR